MHSETYEQNAHSMTISLYIRLAGNVTLHLEFQQTRKNLILSKLLFTILSTTRNKFKMLDIY